MSVHSVKNARQLINEAVLQWPDVVAAPHRFGGVEWTIGKNEVGHMHGNHQIDIVLPSKVRDELVAAGRAEPHHIYPQIGITFYIGEPADVARAIELLRISYDLVQERRQRMAQHVHKD